MSVADWSHVIEASFDKAPFPMTIKRCVTSHNYLTKDYVDYQVVREPLKNVLADFAR